MSDSEGEIHLTQEVTNIDHDLFDCLKEKVGSLDRQNFERSLVDIYKNNEEELKNVRNSMYDYARHKRRDMPEGSLSNRVQRSNGKTVAQKYAADIYLLFHFIEGSVNGQTLQQEVMSSHRRRMDRLNSTMNETFVNETNRDDESANEIDCDTLKNLIEMKQLRIQNNNTFVIEQFSKFEKRQENEIKTLKQQLSLKEKEVQKLKDEIERSRNKETEIRAENKLLRQELNTLKVDADFQTAINRSKKDTEAKHRSLEVKIQNICRKLKTHEETISGPNEVTISENVMSETCSTVTDDSIVCNENEAAQISNENKGNETTSGPWYTENKQNNEISVTRSANNEDVRQSMCYADVVKEKTKSNLRSNNYRFPDINHNKDRPQDIFKGVVKKRSQRIVLYNVDATEQIEAVAHAIKDYASSKEVSVTSTRLLKTTELKYGPSYMISVNIDFRDFYKIENDSNFWPNGITWRKWIPRAQRERYREYRDHDDQYDDTYRNDDDDYYRCEDDYYGRDNDYHRRDDYSEYRQDID